MARLPRPDRDRRLARRAEVEWTSEGRRVRAVPRPAVPELPQHRLDERQRLPELAQQRGRRRRARGRRGIRSVDQPRLQTVELDYPRSSSRDDARWRGLIKLDAAYTYLPTYAEVLRDYNRRPALPVFMVEAGYEFEQNNAAISYGAPHTLRRQEYWTALSGAAGAVLREPLHAGRSRRAGSSASTRPAALSSDTSSTSSRSALVSPRPGPGPQDRHGRVREIRPQRQRRLERLRHHRSDPRPEPRDLVSPAGRKGHRRAGPPAWPGARPVVRPCERRVPAGSRVPVRRRRERGPHRSRSERRRRPRLGPRPLALVKSAGRRRWRGPPNG